MDYQRFLSRKAKRRAPSVLQEILPLASLPGMISFATGVPDTATFPFQRLEVAVDNHTKVVLEGEELARGLQYTPSYGLPGLLAHLKEQMGADHRPPYRGDELSLCTGAGGQDLLVKAFDLLIDEGDLVLVETPTFSGALAALRALGPTLLGVPCDNEGIVPERLEELLRLHKGAAKRPRVLYTIPTGQNPSGATATLARRQAVYALAREYDLLILEDDPYYYVYFGDQAQPPSYLSLDVDHRVLRFDSFSKLLSAGMRLGWVTGPAPLVELLQIDTQATCVSASALVSAIVLKLLQSWGPEGWQRQVAKVREVYRRKRDAFDAACRRHLQGLAEWSHPSAGMFVWIRLLGVADAKGLMEVEARQQKVLLVPGEFFLPSPAATGCVRATYSVATPEQMDVGLARLAAVLRHRQLQIAAEPQKASPATAAALTTPVTGCAQ